MFSYHTTSLLFISSVWVLQGRGGGSLFSCLLQGKLEVKHKHLGQVRAGRKVVESVRQRGNISFSPFSSEVSQEGWIHSKWGYLESCPRDIWDNCTLSNFAWWRYTVCKGWGKGIFLSIMKVGAMSASFIRTRNLTGASGQTRHWPTKSASSIFTLPRYSVFVAWVIEWPVMLKKRWQSFPH